MIKVLTIVGTRPEIIRLSRVISKLETSTNHILVNTNQNYDYNLNKVFFADLSISQPNYNFQIKSGSAIEVISQIISQTEHILNKENPDAVLILGDTNSCLSSYVAKRMKIPIFHMEAGNRCFDQRVPEEINRKLVDQIADINLTYSDIARQHLISEGFKHDRVIKTGSPMKEVIDFYLPKIKKSKILKKLRLTKNKYFLVSAHREENISKNTSFNNFIKMMNHLASNYNHKIVMSTHPRTKKQIKKYKVKLHKNIIIADPFSFTDFVNLEINSKVVLSDSGTINEESSILNFPAINIRESYERPEAMEEAVTMLTGFNIKLIDNALLILESQKRAKLRTLKIVDDYNVNNVSEKVVRIILSYIDYINSKIWMKNSNE